MSWLSSAVSGAVNSVTDALGVTDAQAATPEADQTANNGVDWGNVAGNVASALVGGAGGAAVGYAVGSSSSATRRRRRRRTFPTDQQWGRFERANDMLKGHPNGPALRRQLSWRFFSKYKWI